MKMKRTAAKRKATGNSSAKASNVTVAEVPVDTEFEDRQGNVHPLLNFTPSKERYGFSIGVGKLKLLVAHVEKYGTKHMAGFLKRHDPSFVPTPKKAVKASR